MLDLKNVCSKEANQTETTEDHVVSALNPCILLSETNLTPNHKLIMFYICKTAKIENMTTLFQSQGKIQSHNSFVHVA